MMARPRATSARTNSAVTSRGNWAPKASPRCCAARPSVRRWFSRTAMYSISGAMMPRRAAAGSPLDRRAQWRRETWNWRSWRFPTAGLPASGSKGLSHLRSPERRTPNARTPIIIRCPMDLEQARTNMVEQQIRTWEVLAQDVLDLLYVVPREDFVPPQHRALAFADMQIPLYC